MTAAVTSGDYLARNTAYKRLQLAAGYGAISAYNGVLPLFKRDKRRNHRCKHGARDTTVKSRYDSPHNLRHACARRSRRGKRVIKHQ